MTEHYKNLSLENIIEEVDNVTYVEMWLPVYEHEGLYEVSNFGRIKRCARTDANRHFWPEMIVRSFSSRKYRRVGLFKDGEQVKHQVHRLVGFSFIPNPNNLPQINHKKGIRHDNRSWMLEWSTSSSNHKHAFAELNKKANTPWLGKSGYQHIMSHSVLKISLDGFIVGEYGSKSEAARYYNVCGGTIYNYIKKQIPIRGHYLK